MKRLSYLLIFIVLLIPQLSFGQNITMNDSLYYDSWIGEWYRVENDTLQNRPSFVVKRGLYHSSYQEFWMGPGGNFSTAWRAWDSRTRKWDFAWMSTDGLFQIWEGRKVEGIWYIYKTFILDNGEEVLSRQAFMMENDKLMIRTGEHSSDSGKTWRLRFREVYKKR